MPGHTPAQSLASDSTVFAPAVPDWPGDAAGGSAAPDVGASAADATKSATIEALLRDLVSEGVQGGYELAAQIHRPARAARCEDWPAFIGPEVRHAFQARGVLRPYAHQVTALRA